MKKVLCIILAIFFYILGIIGLLIPVVPQIPFLVIGTVFLTLSSKKIKMKIVTSKFYEEHIKESVKKHKILKAIFEEE